LGWKSFPKKPAGYPGNENTPSTLKSCWQMLGCEQSKCPARNQLTDPCWRIPDTLCQTHSADVESGKYERCLACPVFETLLIEDPRDILRKFGQWISDIQRQSHANAERLCQIIDHLPDALLTMDKKGRITYFNTAAERITGLDAGKAIGLHCRDIFKITTYETDLVPHHIAQSHKNLYNQEFRVTRLDGKEISILSSISTLKDQQGQVIGGMQVFKDMSERKALENGLRVSESKYRRIFEGSKDMIFITTKEGVFKDVNQAGVDLLGYESREELLALSSTEKIYDNPMHRKVYQKEMARQGFVKDFETRFKKKDGTLIHCLVSGNAIKGAGNEIVGYEGIIKDVTARMDAIRDLKKRHRELSLLNSVSLVMNKTQNLDDILQKALLKVLDVLNLDAGGIYLINHEKSAFWLHVQQGLPQSAQTKANPIRFFDDMLMQALMQRELALKPEPIFPPFKATLKRDASASLLALTCFLITAKKKASGFFALDLPVNKELSDQDHHLLGSLGNFLGGAIEKTHLQETIHKHREELKGLTAQLFQSQELERKRIARELHDEAGQALTGINFSLETIEKKLSADPEAVKLLMFEIKQQINRTYQEMRRISYRLHPAMLTDLGLEPALDADLASISKHTDLNINFKMVGFEKRLDPELETVLYRLSQEALTNTLKHAHAKRFHLSIIKSYPNIIFLAEDDGVGFDARKLHKHCHALGLLSMRERAAMLGGSFMLRTAPGKGTRIRIEISLKENTNVC
jgi:PAS domain S-box-containing protein